MPARQSARRDRSLDRGRPQYIPARTTRIGHRAPTPIKVERPEDRGFKSHRSRFDVMDFVLLSLALLVVLWHGRDLERELRASCRGSHELRYFGISLAKSATFFP